VDSRADKSFDTRRVESPVVDAGGGRFRREHGLSHHW
jgi:hypothetical protein